MGFTGLEFIISLGHSNVVIIKYKQHAKPKMVLCVCVKKVSFWYLESIIVYYVTRNSFLYFLC